MFEVDLDGEDQDSATSDHVEKEDHSFILMGRVGVKHSLSHHMALGREGKALQDDFMQSV